jgi:choline dehydrogenase
MRGGTLSFSNTNDPSPANRWNRANMYAAMKKRETLHLFPQESNLWSASPTIHLRMNRAAPCRFPTWQCEYIFLISPRALMMNLHRIINITANWTSALADAGYPTLEALNGGVTMGAFITPSSINPANWTRTYSRSAYIDSLPPRSNLHIFPQATVT